MITSRRSFITGLVSFVAAPAIVRAGSLMPVKVMEPTPLYGIGPAALGLGSVVAYNGFTWIVVDTNRIYGWPDR